MTTTARRRLPRGGRVRRPLAALALMLAAVTTSTSLAVLGAAPASAAGTLDLVAPVTDNYKTWIDDRGGPHDPDNRTSLLMDAIRVGDQTYVVPQSVRDSAGSPVGAPTEWDAAGGIPLALSAGGPTVARLAFEHDGGNAWSYFRLWTDGVFGPLMTIDRATFVADPHPPVAGTFILRSTDGTVLASRAVRYRYDAAIAALPSTSVEWHGALGRWYVGTGTTMPTPLNWPSGAAVSSTSSGTHQAQVSLPAGAGTLYVTPVDLAGIPVPRVPESLSLTWSPSGDGRPTAAAGPGAWRGVPVTLPAGEYDLTVSGTCASACRYDYQPQALTPAQAHVVAGATTYRPDAEIRAAGGEWLGAGTVSTDPTVQSVPVTVPSGGTRTLEVRVTNAGSGPDSIGVADARAGTHGAFTYTWTYQGADVTTQVHDDGWFLLSDVPAGQSRTLQLTVAATGAVGATAQYALHAYHSPASAGIKDVVGTALTVGEPESTGGDYQRPEAAPEVPVQPCSRYAAPGGSDDNPGTKEQPVLSLNRLSSVLEPGQTGCIPDGADLVLPATGGTGIIKGGAPGAPKIIRAETYGARATVTGLGKFLVPATESDLVLMDLDIRGSLDTGGGNLFHVNGDRVMLDGVDLSWPRNICLGVGASGGQEAHDFVLIDSRIHDCGATHDNNPQDVGGAHGAYLQFVRDGDDADAWGAVVYNTLFDHNDARGLQLYPDADDVLVDRAVLYGNGANLNLGSDSASVRTEGARVRHTILGDSRLDFDDPDDPNPSDSNDVVGNFSGAGNNGADNRLTASCLYNTVRPGLLFDAGGTGNVVLSDMVLDQPAVFVDVAARDFRLAAGSPCQDMGLADAARLPGGTSTTPPQDLENLAAPAIAGRFRVGSRVRAVEGSWSPAPVGYGYRWLVGGKPVTGAAGSARTLLLKSAWRGRSVALRLTVLAPDGYLDRTLRVPGRKVR